MKVKKIQVGITSLQDYVQLHKGILPMSDVECQIAAAVLAISTEGKFTKQDKRLICEALKVNGSYLNVYLHRMMQNRVVIPTASGFQLNKALLPQDEDALVVVLNRKNNDI